MKEIKIKPKICEHDLLTKIRNIRRLLPKNKVRVSLIFRGREVTHLDIGREILKRVIEETKDIAKVEIMSSKNNVHFIVLVNK